MVHRNTALLDIVGLKQLDVAVNLNAILVLWNGFILEAARADAFVTFKILRLHALAFFVGFSFEVACRKLLRRITYQCYQWKVKSDYKLPS